jgi:hypothetical protein
MGDGGNQLRNRCIVAEQRWRRPIKVPYVERVGQHRLRPKSISERFSRPRLRLGRRKHRTIAARATGCGRGPSADNGRAEFIHGRLASIRKRQAEAVQPLSLKGMRASISLLGHPFERRSRGWVSHACGSTEFIFAVCRSVAMVAHVLPPLSLIAKRLFFLVMAWFLIARSTMLKSISMRLSFRKRSKMSRREMVYRALRRVWIFPRSAEESPARV